MSETPNLYRLTGHSVEIELGVDLQGKRTVTFSSERSPQITVRRQDIQAVDINNVGELISFPLVTGPSSDRGDPQFSLVVPDIALNNRKPQQFQTIGFKTLNARIGVHERYTYIQLRGTASLLENVTAEGGPPHPL